MTAAPTLGRVRTVLTGPVRPFGSKAVPSGIDKQPRPGPVAVGMAGLDGDAQGDLRVHGGPDKAVHCYPWSHHAAWREALAGHPAALARLAHPGAFGENLSLEAGLDEVGACIGDRWRIGSAEFEVSQGRQPCWKLNERFGVADMSRRVQDSGRAGWYLRVLRPGHVAAGDAVVLLARPHADWPVARLLRAIAERERDPAVLRDVLALPLPASWATLFRRRLDSGEVESWQRRLAGDAAAPPAPPQNVDGAR
mgnify:CR=1 FL=1